MTYARCHLIDPAGGEYHLSTQCVRRAFLCGVDPLTGRDYSHRRQWLVDRILMLGELFAVDLYGYAVMSNHYHVVLRLDPERVDTWSDDEVIDRWLAVSPRKSEATETRKAAMRLDTDYLLELREYLGSASWFMRYINEPLARIANREDDCTGHFWQGRFSSQKLLEDDSILAAMVYVDLNPVRAGLADDVEDAEYTSAHQRLQEQSLDEPLRPLNSSSGAMPFKRTLGEYLELVRWTAQAQASVRRPGTPVKPPSVPAPPSWLDQYLPKPGRHRRAIGSVSALRDYAQSIGQKWIKT